MVKPAGNCARKRTVLQDAKAKVRLCKRDLDHGGGGRGQNAGIFKSSCIGVE